MRKGSNKHGPADRSKQNNDLPYDPKNIASKATSKLQACEKISLRYIRQDDQQHVSNLAEQVFPTLDQSCKRLRDGSRW
ncbi:hypothetical protein J6590_043817 [Homalodisca vitripennis]|nr:hypothetical protein J6590_043817 [Homalodisca vitripennis]